MRATKPVWKTSSFLVYTGGLIVLVGGLAALGYLSEHYGKGALTGWAFVILAVLWLIAEALRRRDRWVAAGVFAFTSVIAWGFFVGATWSWFGWLDNWNSPFGGWSVAHLSLELLILMAAINDERRWDFPFIALISTVAGWFFITDFVSNGGTWTYVVTLVVGIAYLLGGSASDQPSSFWLHVVGGALIGGSLLHWWHSSDLDWALISATALVYVLIAYGTERSSWAVYATIGFVGATVHYLFSTASTTTLAGLPIAFPSISGWAPALAFGLLGFWLVLLGLLGRRVRVATPPPA